MILPGSGGDRLQMAGQNPRRDDSGGRRITHSGHRGAKGPFRSPTRPSSLRTGARCPTLLGPAPDESDVRYPARAAAQSRSIYWHHRPKCQFEVSHRLESAPGVLAASPSIRTTT